MKVLKTTVIETKVATLPDGEYDGQWGGAVIDVKHDGAAYELQTEVGIRGVGVPVTVTILNGVATFDQREL